MRLDILLALTLLGSVGGCDECDSGLGLPRDSADPERANCPGPPCDRGAICAAYVARIEQCGMAVPADLPRACDDATERLDEGMCTFSSTMVSMSCAQLGLACAQPSTECYLSLLTTGLTDCQEGIVHYEEARTDKVRECSSGRCAAGECFWCMVDADCAAAEICDWGRCIPGCRSTADCPSGKVCDWRDLCLDPCVNDADCGPFRRCRADYCTSPPGEPCGNCWDSTCVGDVGGNPLAGYCSPTCFDPEDCPAGYDCVDLECIRR